MCDDYGYQMVNAIWNLLESRVRQRPSDPVLTFVDHLGQRSELSARTLANNVAKAANALRDDAMLDCGEPIRFDVGWHWQRPVWLLASWTLGLTVTTDDGAIRISDLEQPNLDDTCWVVSRHPFGLPEPGIPGHVVDAATAARLQPDAFFAEAVEPSIDAIDAFGSRLSTGAAIERARAIGTAHAVASGERIALADHEGVDGWLWPALVPLVCDISLVMLGAGCDVDAVAAAESARVVG